MNTDNENIENQNIDNDNDKNEPGDTAGTPTDRRPLGYWLRTVDGLLAEQFAEAFQNEGVSRRDWMLLNALGGDVEAPGFAQRLARKGKRLHRLEDLGWAEEQGDGTWRLTDAGREAQTRLGEVVGGIRSRVSSAVSDEDFATTMASLEAIARELGWDESTASPRGRRFGRGFGPGFGPGWGRRFAGGPFGPDARSGFEHGRPGFGPGPWGHGREDEGCRGHHPHGDRGHSNHGHGNHGHCEHGHGEHAHHGGHRGHGHHSHDAEAAYERGFDAGYRRGAGAA